MELLALAALGILVGIPAAAFYAVYRVSVLNSELGSLRDEMASLKRRVRLMGAGPAEPTADRTQRARAATPPAAASRAAPGTSAPGTPRPGGAVREGEPLASTPTGPNSPESPATPSPTGGPPVDSPSVEPSGTEPGATERGAPGDVSDALEDARAERHGAAKDPTTAGEPHEESLAPTSGAPGEEPRERTDGDSGDGSATDQGRESAKEPRERTGGDPAGGDPGPGSAKDPGKGSAKEPGDGPAGEPGVGGPEPSGSGSARGSRDGAPRDESASATAGIDLETLIGSTWLLRIGLGVLAIALALFARTVAPQLPPVAKVALAYAGSIAFFAAGRFYEEKLEGFARPVMAGGLAFGFFVAYASHFIPAMQAVSMPISIAWMVLSMLTVLIAAERWESEPTAILAIVLGHIAAQVSADQANVSSLIMIGFLGLTAIALLLRHHWVNLGLIGVAGSYGAHLLWLVSSGQPPVGNSGFWLSLAFLTSYYVIFLIADVLWWWRESDSTDTPEATLRNARALGPSNLVLYVSLTTFVYFVTEASVTSIEWYFMSLGALQGVPRGCTERRTTTTSSSTRCSGRYSGRWACSLRSTHSR